MEEEGANVVESYFADLKEKYQQALEKNHELSEGIVSLKEQITSSNEELARNAEEMKYYDNLLRQVQSENLTTENEPFIHGDDEEVSEKEEKLKEEHQVLIYEKLREVVAEVDKKLLEYDMIPRAKNKGDQETLFYQSICVIHAEGDVMGDSTKFMFKYQTFRNRTNLTFKKLKDICMDLWDLKGSDVKYSMKFIENDAITKIDNEDSEYNFIDAFLKNKTNIKKARFVLVINTKSNLDSIIDQTEDVKAKNQTENKQNSLGAQMIQNFFEKFVGLSRRMFAKYERVQEKMASEAKLKEADKLPKAPRKFEVFVRIMNNLSLLLFFTFTMVSLINMRPTEKAYQMQYSYMSKFGGYGNTYLNTRDDVKADMAYKMRALFADLETGMSPIIQTNSILNEIRVSFFKTKSKPCDRITEKTCYFPLFDTSTYDPESISDFIVRNQYQDQEDLFPKNMHHYNETYFILSENVVNYLSEVDDNSSKQNYFTYLSETLKPFTVNSGTKYDVSFTGRLGTYTGQTSAADLFFSAPFISSTVFEKIFEIIAHPLNDFIGFGLRALTVDFALYNNFSQFQFYVSILYEFPTNGGILPPRVSVIPFLMNPYMTDIGYLAYAFDVTRVVLIIIIFLFTMKSFLDERRKVLQEEGNTFASFKAFLDARLIATSLIFCFYMACFAIKMIHLTKDPIEYVFTSPVKGFLTLNRFEYFTIVSNYELVIVLDTIIVFFLFFLFILTNREFIRFNIFFTYIMNCVRSLWVYILMILLILISNAIFANNLWGENYDEYRDIASSFMNTLLFSIGHYQKQIFSSQYQIWNIIFTLQFFLIVIYFILSSFPGIFLESYRLTSLEHGYAYDYRKKQYSEKKKKKKE